MGAYNSLLLYIQMGVNSLLLYIQMGVNSLLLYIQMGVNNSLLLYIQMGVNSLLLYIQTGVNSLSLYIQMGVNNCLLLYIQQELTTVYRCTSNRELTTIYCCTSTSMLILEQERVGYIVQDKVKVNTTCGHIKQNARTVDDNIATELKVNCTSKRELTKVYCCGSLLLYIQMGVNTVGYCC